MTHSKTTILFDAESTCLMGKIVHSKYMSWILSRIADSGATCYMNFARSMFFKYSHVTGSEIKMGTEGRTKLCGLGDVKLEVTLVWYDCKFILQSDLDFSDYEYLLIYGSSQDSKGMFTALARARYTVEKNEKRVVEVFLWGSLNVTVDHVPCETIGTVPVASLRLWHDRILQLDESVPLRMPQKSIVHDLPTVTENSSQKGCLLCVFKDSTSGHASEQDHIKSHSSA